MIHDITIKNLHSAPSDLTTEVTINLLNNILWKILVCKILQKIRLKGQTVMTQQFQKTQVINLSALY
jgi:hypothetical protein